MARSKNRVPLFKWACAITKSHYVLISLKSKQITLSQDDKIKKYKIATIRNDIAEQILLGKFGQSSNISTNTTMKPILNMMDRGRVDLFAYDEFAANGMLETLGRNPKDYETVYSLANSETCFAFNKSIDDELITQFQHALTLVVRTSSFKELQKKYFPNKR